MVKRNVLVDCINTVTIRDIREISSPYRKVFIKPAGRRIYYIGNMKDIPTSLLDISIEEITAQPFYTNDTYDVKRYNAEFGFWINSIPERDKRIDEQTQAITEHLDGSQNN